MKVLLVNKFHYFRGGTETYHFCIDELLRSHGHEVIHFAMQDERNLPSPTSEFFVSNVDYNNTKGFVDKFFAVRKMFYSKEAYEKMKALLEREHPDIVHIGLIHKQITYSVLDAIEEYGIPVVQGVHDLIFICPNYLMFVKESICDKCVGRSKFHCVLNKCVKNSRAKSLLAYIENRYIYYKRIYDRIDSFITDCEFYKELLEKDNTTKSKIVNIPCCLPPSKKVIKNTREGQFFLYFGRFSPGKGIMTLIKAYKEACVDTPLVLVGAGEDEEKIRELVHNSGISDKVKFAGAIYGERMESLLDEAKAVIVPSEWYECSPSTAREAMARGRIVIASRIAGIPPLIRDGITGFLFTPQDINELASILKRVDGFGPAEVKKFSEATLDWVVEMFDPEIFYKKLIDVYEQLIQEKKRRVVDMLN